MCFLDYNKVSDTKLKIKDLKKRIKKWSKSINISIMNALNFF